MPTSLLTWLRNRSVRTKIITNLLIVTSLSVWVGALAISGFGDLKGEVNKLSEETITDSSHLAAVKEGVLRERIAALSHVTSVSSTEKTKQESALSDARRITDNGLSAYGEDPAHSEDVRLITSKLEDYRAMIDAKYLPASSAGDYQLVEKLRDEQAAPMVSELSSEIDDLVTGQIEASKALQEEAASTVDKNVRSILMLLGVGVSAALILGLTLSSMITKPLKEVQGALKALEEGDLTNSVKIYSHDEVGMMGQALNSASGKLREALTEVQNGSSELNSSSEHLFDLTSRLAAGAVETSAQAQSVSSASEQIDQNIHTVAAAAEEMGASIAEISRRSTDAATRAQEAVGVAQRASDAMEALTLSSTEIRSLVKSISAIAEQTNLLALNAAIEAARAGAAGKGFAVVAAEVKELSQASAKASEEIAGRVSAIEKGNQVMLEVVGSVNDVVAEIRDHQGSIAAAVEEQTATTQELTRNVSEMAQGTNDIALTISSVAGATEETSKDVSSSQTVASEVAASARSLAALAGKFKLS